MYSDPEQYKLAFVSARKAGLPAPELVFIINQAHLEELSERLHVIAMTIGKGISEYAGRDLVFTFPTTDLFKSREFIGYEKCGYTTVNDSEIWLRLPLWTPEHISLYVLTIHILMIAANAPFEKSDHVSNHLQQASIMTHADHFASHGYGHAIFGSVSPSVLAWLKEYATTTLKEKEEYAPMPIAIVNAMKETWCAISPKDEKRWVEDCRGAVSADGRFFLGCFGNACDLAIYPDQFFASDEVAIPFSCHNLDRDFQQLTLLAGFAKLCELARENT